VSIVADPGSEQERRREPDEMGENADGTITVSPSILVSDHSGELYHGFLVDGEWRAAA
jgi:hypothetical protein